MHDANKPVNEVAHICRMFHLQRNATLKEFCERHGTQMIVMNGETFSPEEELVRDLIAIVTVFSARLHCLRSYKNLIRAAALGKDVTDDQGTQDQTPSHT